jgi:hypothetical protein
MASGLWRLKSATRAEVSGGSSGEIRGRPVAMGRDRGVLRWDVRDWLLRAERARLERELARAENTPDRDAAVRRARLEEERAALLTRARALGPSPRAKMG